MAPECQSVANGKFPLIRRSDHDEDDDSGYWSGKKCISAAWCR